MVQDGATPQVIGKFHAKPQQYTKLANKTGEGDVAVDAEDVAANIIPSGS